MQRLNGREIYVIILLVIVTVILSVAFVMGLVSDYSTLPAEAAARESVKVKDLVDHINTLLLVVLGIAGSILMVKKKPGGWILALTLLSLFTFVAVVGMISSAADGVTFIAVGVMALFFITGIVFLFLPATIQKYRVSKKVILPTLLLFMALAAFYIFLQ